MNRIYFRIEDLLAAKKDLCVQIGEEGCVLLRMKNNALPISKKDKVSVFGRNNYPDFVVSLSSGGGKISGDDDLKTVFDIGLSINETLWNFICEQRRTKEKIIEEKIRVGEIDPALILQM